MRSASAILDSGAPNATALESFLRHSRAISEMMRDHIYKEDRILFPLVARFLSGVRDAYLAREMEAFTGVAADGSQRLKSRF
jgi:iron-sulfur cluster repair protein YtfE (RIC family)